MNRVFILGAGFSYHISGGKLPLMAQLADEFKDRHGRASQYLYQSANLEHALTKLDLELLGQDNGRGQVPIFLYKPEALNILFFHQAAAS